MGVGPIFRALSDVSFGDVADGDLFTYQASTGKMIPITRAALGAAVVLDGSFTTIIVDAGFADFSVNMSAADIVTGITVCKNPGNPAYFGEWEALWVAGSEGTSGRFLGPGVTTFIGTPPARLGTSAVAIRIYNRSASTENLKIHWCASRVVG